MSKHRMGQVLLLGGALLLAATAAIHAVGREMAMGWGEGLPDREQDALCLVWLTDSLSWAVAAALWVLAALRPSGTLRIAAALSAMIPLLTGVGIAMIDPTFCGGHLLLTSAGLALAGAALLRSEASPGVTAG